MVHRGKIVKQRIKDEGHQLKTIFGRLGVSRNTLTNYLEDDLLDFKVILKIGRIIHHDFSEDFQELENMEYDERSDLIILVKEPREMDDYQVSNREIMEEIKALSAKLDKVLTEWRESKKTVE